MGLRDPIILDGQQYDHEWGDDFDDPSLPLWSKHTLRDDDLHRAGNKYLQEDGSIMRTEWPGAPGARWAARYDRNQGRTCFVEDGQLVFKPVVQEEKNHLNESFEHKGIKYPTGETILSLAWVCSIGARKWSNEHNRHITNFNKPYYVVTRGCVIDYVIDFTRMNCRNLRHSIWLMPLCGEDEENTPENPATVDEMTKAYDADISHVEDDLHEYVSSKRRNFDLLSMKFVAGSKDSGGAGDTGVDTSERSVHGTIDLTQTLPGEEITLGEMLRTEPVHFRMIWHKDGSRTWQINGYEVQHDPRQVKSKSYFVLSMEANMGVEDAPGKIPTKGPKRQYDPGLDGQPWLIDADIAEQSETRMHHIHVYRLNESVQPIASDPVVEQDQDLDDLLVTPDITLSDTDVDTAEVVEALSSEIDRLICVNNALQIDITNCQRDNERLQSELYNLRNMRPNAAVKQSKLQTILKKARGIK